MKSISTCKYFALVFLLASILFSHPVFKRKIATIAQSRAANDSSFTGVLLSDDLFIDTKSRAADEPSLDDESLTADDHRTEKYSIKSINLIGERHCGTKWITKHLQDCFGGEVEVLNRYTRWKHWFQYDDKFADEEHYHPPNSSLVVAMFRDPFDWVDSMRKKPYHSPNHFDLDWEAFVTTPWTMARGHDDEQLMKAGSQCNATCMHRFSFDEVVPCSPGDRKNYNGTYQGNPIGPNYELNHDSSGQPYGSIVDLRRDKIQNFLDVAYFEGVHSFLPVQFEFMVSRGTSELIDEIENITGFQAHCKRMPPQPLRPKVLDAEFVAWMNDHVDFKVEQLIGYSKRDS
ncbi:hypothetical protein ACHAXR_010222 [Thalassiosira sp. AJA248-18]